MKTLDFAGVLRSASLLLNFWFSCFWLFSAFGWVLGFPVCAAGLPLEISAWGENPLMLVALCFRSRSF